MNTIQQSKETYDMFLEEAKIQRLSSELRPLLRQQQKYYDNYIKPAKSTTERFKSLDTQRWRQNFTPIENVANLNHEARVKEY